MARVCLGGTFDVFHRGHEALLRRALEIGDEYVFIGVTSDGFAQSRRDRAVRPFEERAAAVRAFVRANATAASVDVAAIEDSVGRAYEPLFDAIAVTPETRGAAERINAERRARGSAPLRVALAPFFLGEDGLRVSATRIRAGEIDRDGRLLGVVRVAVGSTNPAKLDAVRNFVAQLYPSLEVRGFGVPSGVPVQPQGDSTWQGAEGRAAAAMAEWPEAHFAIGIEAGLLSSPVGPLDVQACVVLDRGGRMTAGHGPGFSHPPPVGRAVEAGRSVGEAIAELAGDPRVPGREGAIGYLSRGMLKRATLTESALLAAWLPRLRPDLYDIQTSLRP